MFKAKMRYNAKDKLIEPWQLKIVRSHKIGEIQRDEATKRAWFTVGQTHSDHINTT